MEKNTHKTIHPMQSVIAGRTSNNRKKRRMLLRHIAGPAGLVGTTLMSCVYGWWGIVANFHFGWYHPTLFRNLVCLFGYLTPTIIIVLLAVCALNSPSVGFGAHLVLAIGLVIALFFSYWSSNHSVPPIHLLVTATLLVMVGTFYWLGQLQATPWALLVVVVPPLLTVAGFGFGPAFRVAHRFDDGIRSARIIDGKNVRLLWAGEGRGWPRTPNTWHEAQWISFHLGEDGATIFPTPQNIWRLPTVDELVGSLTRDGRCAGGTINLQTQPARFDRMPEKESPLWIPKSPIIYFWTATEADKNHAMAVCFNGRVVNALKDTLFEYRGFRAVRAVNAASALSSRGIQAHGYER